MAVTLRGTDSSVWSNSEPPLVTILVAKHAGRTYPQAVAVAKQAELYREQAEGKAVHHVATFGRTAEQASAAGALLSLTVNLRSSVVFDGDGLTVPSKWTATQVLDGFRQASLCADPRAYCHVVINDPFAQRGEFGLRYRHDRETDRWLLPCHLINSAYLAFDARHPSSVESLIQAAAVSNGSQWCPNFDAKAFRPLLVETEGQERRKPMQVTDEGH